MIELASVENCTGCQACYNACTHQALSMKPDEEGFVQPVINNDKCIECHACERACPVISPIRVERYGSPKAYAVWSNPDRTVSSSGGAFSAFARLFLSKNGVVFGAAFDENLHLHHMEIDNCEDLQALRGSKYVQSDIGETYKSVH
jgi:coenzyme F420-reducing hydrogenase beta subunit